MHSRYASNHRQIDIKHAHPVSDSKGRVLVFHNGFITNTSELIAEIEPDLERAQQMRESLTDSQLIAVVIGIELDKGLGLRQAVKSVIETKLLGTWRLVVMHSTDAKCLYASTNSGVLFLGKSADSIILSSSSEVASANSKRFNFEKLDKNVLYEITDECLVSTENLQKKISLQRQPKPGYAHIVAEEIYQGVDAINNVIEFGSKFISSHEVLLGGFERSREELRLVQNLVIATEPESKFAAEYGASLFKHLCIFDSVRVSLADKISKPDLQRLHYGGYLTLSVEGSSKTLTKGIDTAHELGLTCINIVNVEDSPITRVIPEKGHQFTVERSGEASVTEDATLYDIEESIGMYTKFGFCYSDLKAFVPQVISLALVALWFSAAKTTKADKEVLKQRQDLVKDISGITHRLKSTLA